VNEIGIEVGAARMGSRPRCPFCREDLADLPACECSTCAVGYHLECAQELPGCATVGCEGSFQASCSGCGEVLDVQAKTACGGCGRAYHPLCRTQAETCVCGDPLKRERPILRARRSRGLGDETRDLAITAFQVITLLVVAGIEIYAMAEITTSRRGMVHHSPMLFMLAPLVLGTALVSLPYLLGWKSD